MITKILLITSSALLRTESDFNLWPDGYGVLFEIEFT